MEETSGLSPAETAYFESGGQTNPESVESTSSETTESSSQETQSSTQTSGEEQTQTEVKQETKPEPQQKQEKTVPLAALHQARAEMKELKAQKERMEQLFQQLVQERQQTGRQQEQPQIPSLETDPVNHFAYKNQLLERQLAEERQHREQWQRDWEQRQQQTIQEQQFRSHVARLENEFASNTPDYQDATNYLKQSIANDLEMRGVDPADIPAYINQQIHVMTVQAIQTGMNPAQLAYHMAQARGFRPPVKEQPQNTQKQVTNEEKIANINKGQSAAKSLSATGGKGKPDLTLESLAEMDADDLEKHWKDISKMMR